MNQTPQAAEPSNASQGRPMSRWLMRHARLILWVYWPCLVVGTHWPNLKLMPERERGPFADVLMLDKILHAVGFGGLMLLLIMSGLGGRGRAWPKRCAIALWIGLGFAVLDELSQGLVSGRTLSASDMLTNVMAVLGVYIVAILPSRREPPDRPRWLIWSLAISVPAVAFTLLSPAVIKQLRALRDWVEGPTLGSIHPYDYVMHGLFSMAISILVIILLPMASRRARLMGAVTLLGLVLAGPGVEIIQYYTGRSVQSRDVLGHSIGVFVAMIWWAVRLNTTDRLHAAGLQALAATGTGTTTDSLDTQVESDPAGPRFVGHAVLVSALTLLSRFAGLARDAVLAAAIGLSAAADAFFIGFLVPNLFRRLFGEGALTAAFIPNYTTLLERDPQLAKRFATLTLTLLSVLLIGITLIAELVLWWVATSIDPNHKASLAVYYTRLMLPYMPMICAVALVGGVLQVHKRFGPPAAAPLVLNGVIVLAVLLATGFFGQQTEAREVATWVAVGVLVAGLLQLAWQVVVLLSVTGLARSFAGCWATMRSMLIMMIPMVIGLAVFQINALLDALIAFFFAPAADDPGGTVTMFGSTFDAPLRNGDVAALNWSQRLYQFPLGVFGIAIATAIFPALAAAAAKFAPKTDGPKPAKPQAASTEFADIVRHGLRLTVFIALPASVGLILVRVPLARTVFEHGGFTTNDALRVSVILAGYASSVWAYSMTHTLTRAFYALKDATTPLKVSACMVLLNLTLNLTLIWSLGAAGLAWSTAISAVGQVALLLLLLRRRVPGPIDREVVRSWGRTLLATVVMAGVLLPITVYADPASLSWMGSAGLLLGLVALGAGVVFAVARLTRAQELGWLLKRSVK